MALTSRIGANIERLCTTSMDTETFRREVVSSLRRAVPFDAFCWSLLDPDAFLPYAGISDVPFQTHDQMRCFELDAQEGEPLSLIALSQLQQPVSRLGKRIRGEFSRSLLWQEVLSPHGLNDELRVVLRTGDASWSLLILYRDRSARSFSEDDELFLGRLIQPIATKLRQTMTASVPAPEPSGIGPGVVVLGDDLMPVTMTPLARQWLSQIWPYWLDRAQLLPPTLPALVARLRAIEKQQVPPDFAPIARIRSLSGRWFVVQVERFTNPPQPGAFALTLQPATPTQMQSLLLLAYALTRRERQLTLLALQGLTTAEVAAALHISTYTVQEHLKTIFAKVGVRSRLELAALLQNPTFSL